MPSALLDAQLRQAVGLYRAGRFAEAEQACRQILALDPKLPVAHLLLGDTLAFQQRFAEAVTAYRRAIALKPDYAEAWNNLGNALLLMGDREPAAEAFRKLIALRPDQPQAHISLGSLLHQSGRFEEAQSALRTAIRLAPGHAGAYVNLSASLYETGQMGEAEQAALKAISLEPRAADARNALGNALRERGQLAEAEAQYRMAIALKPDYAEAFKHLAMNLEEMGRLDEAFALFRRHAALAYGHDDRAAEPPHKRSHDSEQRAWLDAHTSFTAEAPRLPGPAVNPANNVAGISETWRTAKPQIAVIDNLLTPGALQALREYCLGATVWRQAYERGYLGAFPEHGFATPLIAQIAEELRGVYPAIIGEHPLLHFWAFKYDSSLQGIKMHADFAAVNVNFWITPDDASLDPESGGLVVWDVAAPLDWDFARYNAAEEDIRGFLAREKARPVRVPYRANRAVIFDLDLFHETDTIRFKPGYENRRINVTLLYGRRRGVAPET